MAEINSFISKSAAKEVKDYEKAIDRLITKYGQLDKAIAALNRELKTEEKTQKKLTTRQKEAQKLRDGLRKTTAQLEQSESKLNKARIKSNEKLKEQNRILREQAKAELGIKKRNGLFKSMTKSILAAGAAMLSLQAAVRLFSNSIKTIASFEEAMSKVKAVTGALPRDFKALQKSAKDLGSTTSKTAREVAGLQLEFAKLGFSTAEILNATEATISLSIAAGSDLADSAVVAASTIRGFGLNAEETQRVVDVMAKSFSSSALDLEKFKTAMATVAPVAKASGKDIEFTTAQLSVLADSGLDASTAGTSLRNMFLELNKQGLTWEQGLEKINTSTNKNVTALELFGKRGATAGLILADNIDKATKLEEAYDGAAGSAEEMARIMEDNLIGDTKKLSSAWEGFILGLNSGDGIITKVLRNAVKFLTEIVGHMSYLSKSAQQRAQEWQDSFATDRINKFAKKLDEVGESEEERNKLKEDEIKLTRELIIATRQRADELEAQGLLDEAKRHDNVRKGYVSYLEVLLSFNIAKKEETEIIDESTDSIDKETKAKEKNVKTWAKDIERMRTSFAFHEKVHEERKKLEEENSLQLTDELKKRYDANKAYLDKVEQDELMAAEKKKEIQQAITAEVINIGNLGFDLQQSRLDRELDAVQTNYDARINAAEGNSELQEALARELAQKQYEIQTEQAKAEKNQALFNIAINTAEGVSKALAEGGIAGIALGALVTASGIAQAAIVSNQPMPQVPQFATGTDYSPSTFIAGDGGRELGITKDGQTFLTPNKSTLYTGMEGTQIIPNAQTEQILAATNEHAAGMINMDQLGYKLDAVVDAVEKDRLNVNFDKHGVWNYSKGKSNFIARKNSKFMS